MPYLTHYDESYPTNPNKIYGLMVSDAVVERFCEVLADLCGDQNLRLQQQYKRLLRWAILRHPISKSSSKPPPLSENGSQFTSGLSFSRFKQRDEHGGLNINLSSINRVLNLSTGNVGLFQWVKSIMLTFVENNSVDLPKTGTAFSFCTFLPGQFTLDEVNFTSSSEGNFVRVFVFSKMIHDKETNETQVELFQSLCLLWFIRNKWVPYVRSCGQNTLDTSYIALWWCVFQTMEYGYSVIAVTRYQKAP
ncbi:hypothetical protein L2E82_51190 [Cichorium intybus]|nr:hypothetical protein L2E82_51190 [Cichorium intybus]